jgi:hypothetical protein
LRQTASRETRIAAHLFEASECQVCTAVGAVAVQDAELALLVAKKDKVLAHELHGLERTRAVQFFGQGHRLPVAAQQLACRHVRPDAGHQVILFSADHGELLRVAGCMSLHAMGCIVFRCFDEGQ